MTDCYWKWFLVLSLVIFSPIILAESNNKNTKTQKQSLVEVRAVFINCETDALQNNLDSPGLRFERQELFKHNALRGCKKKLALTVKIASPDPDNAVRKFETSGEEYIPIDHVFEGADRKRVRLLNPYILRLRHDAPKQAYKLRRIDTVSGVLTGTDLTSFIDNATAKRQGQSRERRELDSAELLGSAASSFILEHENPQHSSYSVRIGRLQELIKAVTPKPQPEEYETTQDCGLRLFNTVSGKGLNLKTPPFINQMRKSIEWYGSEDQRDKRWVCTKTNDSSRVREKREYQKQIMTVMDDGEGIVTPRYLKHYHRKVNEEMENQIPNNMIQRLDEDKIPALELAQSDYEPHKVDVPKHARDRGPQSGLHQVRKHSVHKETNVIKNKILPHNERQFAVYEIGNPNLWYDIKVHLFEKLSTPEGKTVWNDFMKGVEACVSSANPEWKGQDVNVRYQPAEWVPRDDFTLPMTKLCLLEPLHDNNLTLLEDEPQEHSAVQNYIVVPVEDLVYLRDKTNVKKRNKNISSEDDAPNENDDPNIQVEVPRRVEVRVSRAIIGGRADNFNIANLGSDQFLTLPHRRPHHSQIDVEVRADDNVLVRVGSSGRLATVVTDNNRKKRTTVYFQATNTGLASARFKGVIRECGPELTTLIREKGTEEISSEPILLPPHHTRRLKLEVPVEISAEVSHCNVALVNDEDESVAVRDVSIKKGDRCFCVWHCECVCLSDDPKLLCREMSQPQQVAAGLAPLQRPRHARSVCYTDVIAVDFVSVLFAILIFLLMLGFIKAIVGLWNVKAGQLGWQRVLDCPRVIECYFEPCLRGKTVVYKDGWPVHPDTKLPTVRVLSCPASFLLNLVFFIVVPTIAIHTTIRKILGICKKCICKTRCKIRKVDEQIFSAHDLQSESLELIVRKKRKRKLTDWMSPFAEQLTTDVMHGGVEPALIECRDDNEMQPLLHDMKLARSEGGGSVLADSEQEDTDYVLMQMQKSRESLARSQKKLNDSVLSTDRNLSHAKGDTLATTSKN